MDNKNVVHYFYYYSLVGLDKIDCYCKETSWAKGLGQQSTCRVHTKLGLGGSCIIHIYTHRHLCIYNHFSFFSQTQNLTHSPGWPGTQHVDQYVLKLKYLSASAF